MSVVAAREASVEAKDERRTVKVVYLAGDGRSGTTLLSRILGSYDGCLAVGELYDIWIESREGNRICSCGDPLHSCTFWNAVMNEAFGGVDQEMIESIIELRTSVQGVRHVPLMMFPWMRPPAFKRRLKEYVEVIERLYIAIQQVSECDVIVDSSKLATYAIAVNQSKAIDVSFLHITRDSRACVYSWRRQKRDSVAGSQEKYMPQRSHVRSAVVWGIRNVILTLVSRRFTVSTKLRYEDFVCRPRASVTELAKTLGLNERSAHWTSEDELAVLNANHIFAGNPNRVEQGVIRVRSDDEWRARMSRGQKWLVTALTFPVLWRLGYLGKPRATTGALQPEVLVENPLS